MELVVVVPGEAAVGTLGAGAVGTEREAPPPLTSRLMPPGRRPPPKTLFRTIRFSRMQPPLRVMFSVSLSVGGRSGSEAVEEAVVG